MAGPQRAVSGLLHKKTVPTALDWCSPTVLTTATLESGARAEEMAIPFEHLVTENQ